MPLFIALIIAIIALSPIFTILSVNLLFSTNWPIDFPHWLAVFWLMYIIANSGMKKD